MAKKGQMEILMKIKADVDKALPANIGKISKELKEMKSKTKELKDMEKLYQKQASMKKALGETIAQYKKQETELQKLENIKKQNRKLNESEIKLYRQLKGDMRKLNTTIEKSKTKLSEYDKQVSKLPKSFSEVTKGIKDTGKAMDRLNAKKKISDKVLGVKKKIGNGVKKGIGAAKKTVVGGAIAGTIALGAFSMDSAKNYTEFNGQMKRVQALSRSTKEEFNLMEDAAIKLGSTTSFTGQQAGEGMEFLALAGFKANQIIEAMPGLLDLAAASGEDLGSVSDIVSDNLSAFGLAAKDAGHFADVMALASSSTNTTVGMLGEAFSYVAAPAHALGVSLEETSAILGIMANNGIKASQGGTALRSALLNLSAPSKEAQGAIDKLGLKTKDNNGNFLGMGKVIEQLQGKFKGLTDVQQASYAKSLFGKTAVSGMLSVINSAPGSIKKMTKELENSGGAAKEMANTILDGPKGALTLLSSAYDGVRISFGKKLMGEGAVKGIKTITSYISELANVINGSFNNNPANEFWHNIFSTTKTYFGKLNKTIEPIKKSISNIFSGISGDGIKRSLKVVVKIVTDSVLVIVGWVAKILEFLEPVIKFLVDHKDEIAVFFGAFMIIGKVVGIVSWLVGSISGLIGIVSAAGGVFSTLGAVLTTFGGPIVWLIALLGVLAYTIYKNWDDIVALTEMLMETLKEVFSNIGDYFDELHTNFAKWLNSVKTGIVNAFNNLVVKAGDTFKFIGNLLIGFKDKILNFGVSIKDSFMSLLNTIIGNFTSLGEGITSVFTSIKEVVTGAIQWYINAWSSLFKWYINLWVNTFNSIGNLLIGFKDKILNFGVSIKDSFVEIPNAIKNSFTSVFGVIKEKMSEVREMIKLPKPPEWVVSIASKIKSSLGVDGSHYNGLSNVPYDGYIAELHKNERVLTASENEEYNSTLGTKFNSIKTNSSTSNISTNTTRAESSNKFIFNPNIRVTVDGGGDIEERISEVVEERMKEAMRIFREQMEAMYGSTRTSF